MEKDYSRNGFSLVCVNVKLFNRMVEMGTLKERGMSSKLYLFRTNKGKLRRNGYVAFTYDSAVFHMTKKGAIEKYKKVVK